MIGLPITELTVGQSASLTRVVTRAMIAEVAGAIGDENPVHSDDAFAALVSFPKPIAPGILTGGLVSAAIGTLLPGPGTLYMNQNLCFKKPVFPGDTLTARIEIVELMPERNRARLNTVCVNQHGEEVLIGEAWVKPPKTRIVYDETAQTRPVPGPLTWGAVAVQAWSGAAAAFMAAWLREPTS